MSSDTESGGGGAVIADEEESQPNCNDWICNENDCKNLNFARRTVCNRCNKEKTVDALLKKKLGTEIGKVAAEKSRGLFSAEDWQCSKCANVNWARRQTCNMCNAPKFTNVEERTGYGGGYNDRGVVEYKEREDSDGEFDEFGRKKKPKDELKIKNDSPVRSLAGKSMLVDEEDEDDGDEGDLSKYALFDSDDDNKKSDNNKSSNSSNSSSSSDSYKHKSRSRSRSVQKEKKLRDKISSTRHSSRSSGSSSRSKNSRRSDTHRKSKSPRDHYRRKSYSRSRSRSTGHGKYKDNRRR